MAKNDTGTFSQELLDQLLAGRDRRRYSGSGIPHDHSALMLVAARLRHIASTKWASGATFQLPHSSIPQSRRQLPEHPIESHRLENESAKKSLHHRAYAPRSNPQTDDCSESGLDQRVNESGINVESRCREKSHIDVVNSWWPNLFHLARFVPPGVSQ